MTRSSAAHRPHDSWGSAAVATIAAEAGQLIEFAGDGIELTVAPTVNHTAIGHEDE